jgi:GGDEF domain-containing protein
MSSGGFFLGRQPQKSGTPKSDSAPERNNLIQLLTQAQKTADKPFTFAWQPKDKALKFTFVLSVMNYTPQQERRNWTKAADGSSKILDPEWTLNKEIPGEKNPVNLWTMRTSDTELVLNLIADSIYKEETGASGGSTGAHSGSASGSSGEISTSGNFRPPSDPNINASGSFRIPQQQDLNSSGSFRLPTGQPANHLADQQARSAALQLSGNLNEVDLSNVMQSIGLFQLTGKLGAYGQGTEVEIYFVDGEVVHACQIEGLDGSKQITGDSVILEVFTWQEGGFQFQHGWKQSKSTITRRMPSLIMEGVALRDYRDALAKEGVTSGSQLERSKSVTTEQEFDAKVKEGLPLHLDLQKRVFICLRTPMTLDALLEQLDVPKAVWMPVIFSLISTGLITVSGAVGQVDPLDTALFNGMDVMIAGASKVLQSGTGMVNYAMFLLMLQNECARAQAIRMPFCLALVEIDCGRWQLTDDSLRSIGGCFEAVKRPFDVLAHMNPNLLLIILPHSSLENAHQIVNAFLSSVTRTQLDSTIQGAELGFFCGLACAPDDGTEMIELMSAASRLRRAATNSSIATSRPLKAPEGMRSSS